MRDRLRQFIDSLNENPLFAREWRRVFGRRYRCVLRVILMAILLCALSEAMFRLRWHTKMNRSSILDEVSFFLRAVVIWALLNPANLFATVLAWWSIEFEHRRGMAGQIALTRLKDRDLFWGKAVPTICFAVIAIWVYYAFWHIYFVIQYDSANTLRDTLHLIFSRAASAISYSMSIFVCYLLLLKWPALRRSGVVVLPALFLSSLIDCIICYFPVYAIHPWFNRSFRNSLSPWWMYLFDPAFRTAVTLGVLYLLIEILAPQFRCLFLGEAPRFPFVRVLRGRVKVRRIWRGARTWTGP